MCVFYYCVRVCVYYCSTYTCYNWFVCASFLCNDKLCHAWRAIVCLPENFGEILLVSSISFNNTL